MNAKTIGYYLVLNATGSGSGYLIHVVPNGVVYTPELTEGVLANITTSASRAEMVWKEALRVAIEHVKRGETVDIGGVRLRGVIPGSMECEDSPFIAGVNEFQIATYADTDLNNLFANIVPYRLNVDDIATKTKVSNIMEVATQKFSLINGTKEFAVLGNNVTLDDEGEYVKLLDKKTLEPICTANVVRVSKGQRGYCKLPSPVTAGDYVTEIATKGLIGASVPAIFRKPVTVLESLPDPVINSMKNMDGESFGPSDTDGFLDGEHLTGATVKMEYSCEPDPETELHWEEARAEEFSYEVKSDTRIQIHQDDAASLGCYRWRYTVTTPGGTSTTRFDM